ncbi:MAG: DUF6514 family protein [Oscillospiraceae bacterium]|jgi:hypothetical protein|nr:DUF6514 family protein [Oscillospiraceae bacterium]MCI1991249.1 DUF6514 family protein [Oscillospiraceae bacterium]MCI2036131.1 DUF6514 family protein [Oscillospiraceae bacterium]
MVKFLGSADLPGVCLKYYVFGNHREGYGIRILRANGECANQYVSRKLSEVLDLAYQLRRCSVFPDNLGEILEDLQYDAGKDDTKKVFAYPKKVNRDVPAGKREICL